MAGALERRHGRLVTVERGLADLPGGRALAPVCGHAHVIGERPELLCGLHEGVGVPKQLVGAVRAQDRDRLAFMDAAQAQLLAADVDKVVVHSHSFMVRSASRLTRSSRNLASSARGATAWTPTGSPSARR